MKPIKGFRLWQILYPIGIYYVVSSLTYFALQYIIGNENDTYMLRQLICAAMTIPFSFSFYRQGGFATGIGQEKRGESPVVVVSFCLAAIVSGACLGMAVNNILAMTPLMQASAGFQTANEAFFGGQVVYELLGSGLLIPFAEELLFRGVVYGRIKLYYGRRVALAGSALLFGVFHVNMVQFIYATLLGLVLAVLAEYTGHLYAAVLGHIAANLAAVVRAHTGWLDFSYQLTPKGVCCTIVLAAAGAIVLWGCVCGSRRNSAAQK